MEMVQMLYGIAWMLVGLSVGIFTIVLELDLYGCILMFWFISLGMHKCIETKKRIFREMQNNES